MKNLFEAVNQISIVNWAGNQPTKSMHLSSLCSQSFASVLRLAMVIVCATMLGCLRQTYEKELFAIDHVRVVHSERHCKDAEQSTGAGFPNADLVFSRVDGLGYFVATKTAWETRARQLAAELDADISLISPCEGEGVSFQYAQIQVWRSRGFRPTEHEEHPAEKGTLSAPPHATYGARLRNIFDCLEQARAVVAPPTAENKVRLGSVDATEFFSSDAYFPGYAKIDSYFRPTRAAALRLSMILSDPYRAAIEADWYWALSPSRRTYYAEQYLICLFDRGYSW